MNTAKKISNHAVAKLIRLMTGGSQQLWNWEVHAWKALSTNNPMVNCPTLQFSVNSRLYGY